MPSSNLNLPHLPIHHASQSYTDEPTRSRTLDLWLPRPLEDSDPKKHVWIVYIHGGAWRDPLQTSQTLLPTLKHLSPIALSKIAGIASIDYRLSPYPKHPDEPSKPDDAERNVRHPVHIADVASALNYLGAKWKVGGKDGDSEDDGGEEGGFKWIGIGHSCGATLLCQYVSRIGLHDSDIKIAGPVGLILLEGIYDLSSFLKNHKPPKCSPEIAQIYEDIVVGAFTESKEAWKKASPVSGKFTEEQWKEGRLVYLCYSNEDELVEVEQAVEMRQKLKDDGWSAGKDAGDGRIVERKALHGKHDWIWEDGTQIAKRIDEIVEGIAKHL
ncbi:Alpha/Beta hydrolase protein [Lophiotrema nucula]|uniref:Kynurenine formamidase n=1 Tax=Lophiotrema nucula TaxID=690887 RepID=A0A6A5YMY9_9PLEO|nr:Alpha/Beta hydrolase protein [Lophiotrema nucula]